jgi:hypothetical protein
MRPPFTTAADTSGGAIAFRLSHTLDPDGVVTFIDVCGVYALLDLASRANAAGGSLKVTNPPPIVPRVLRILGLEHGLKLDTSSVGTRRDSTAPTRAECCNATVRSHRTLLPGAARRTHRRLGR